MNLALALLELPARHAEPKTVLAEVDSLIGMAPADLVVLPEAAITGYVSPRGDFDLRPQAEARGGPTEVALAEIAARHRVHLAAPLIERDGDAFYNSFLVFDRSGTVIASYRKRHPWYPEAWATAGSAPPPSFSIDGVETTIAICFDVHTLVDECADVLERAELLLFPSAWVEDEGVDLRAELLPPIAKQFDLAIANANWSAGDVKLHGQGRSRVYAKGGALVAEAKASRLDVRLPRGTQ